MRFSRSFFPTLRDVPSEADISSHKLMLKAGLIRQVASGVFTILPLGLRVFRKIERIIREEMNGIGGQELIMPSVQPRTLWNKSGRWEEMVKERILLQFQDRSGREYCYGPTHEEVITDLVSGESRSYRQFPLLLYQFQTKFRDEIRPRFGLMRAREFVMKDAYSFDLSPEMAMVSYEKVRDAYRSIFKRCNLNFRVVEASTGAMGGQLSHEYQVLADVGEDAIFFCDQCDYAANIEMAEIKVAMPGEKINTPPLALVDTANCYTVEEVSTFLKIPASQFIKTLFYTNGADIVAILTPGDRELNLTKAQKYLQWEKFEFASAEQVEALEQTVVGYAGPINLFVRTIGDVQIRNIKAAVVGANQKGKHYINALLGRDFILEEFGDLTNARSWDQCARCDKGKLLEKRGIEVGHTFVLGTKYSKVFEATYLNERGLEQVLIMGCYGIGVGRTMAAIIEQNHDEKGICWPLSVAPFHLIITSLVDKKNSEMERCGDEVYTLLSDLGLEVLYDERTVSSGVKFSDADLLGIPVRITLGPRSFSERKVEIKYRDSNQTDAIAIKELESFGREFIKRTGN